MIMKKLKLMIVYADCYIYLLPGRLLDLYNSIKTYLSFHSNSKKGYVFIILNFLHRIILVLILCCPFLFIGFIFAILNIDVINIVGNYFIFMEGNPQNPFSGQSGNSFGGSGGSGGSGGPGGSSGGNNN